MYKVFLWCPGCFLFLLISTRIYCQNNPRNNGNIPDTILNHGLILKEVVVKASPKIVVKRDTVSFSADAFTNNSEKVVEDLLKKLPGIDVAKDGSITVNGKKVERILVDGDDLFKKDYPILSRNLSAGIIDKVQVIDNYTDNALLKGLVSNDNKVINLTLKDKQKKMLFGNIVAGIGTADRQDISGNLISFMNKTKIYCLGNYNTTGRDPVPGIADQNGIATINNNSINGADNINLVNISRVYKTEVDPERINFNKARLFSSFVSHNPCPNLTVRFSGWSFLDNNVFTQTNSYLYYLEDSTIAVNEHNSYNKKPVSTTGNMDISYNCDKKSNLKFSSVLTSTAALTTADMLSNGSLYYSKLKENNFNLSNVLTYIKRINDTNALMTEATFTHHREKQDLSIEQYPARYLPFTNLSPNSLYQLVSYPFDAASLFCHYIYVKRSWRMNVDIGATLRSQYLHSSLDTLAFVKQISTISDSFLNKEHLRRYASNVSFTLARQVNKFRFTISLSGNFLYNRLISAGHKENELSKSLLYPSISTGVRWKGKDHTVSVCYSYDTKFPEITDMYEGYLFTDYRSLQKGINHFISQPIHTALFGYTYSSYPKQLMLYLTVSCMSINKVPVSSLQLTENYDIITRTSPGSAIVYSLYTTGIDKFINILYGGIKIKTSISVNKYQDALNGAGNRQIKNMGSITQFSFRSTFRGIFNYNIGIILNYSRSSIANVQGALFKNHIMTNFLDLHFKFSDKLNATVNNERYYFNEINKGKRSYYFTDLSLQYELIKSKLSFIVTGKNLTNNKKYIYTQITDYSSQTQQYDLMPLYLLLQLVYRFK